jgi:phosphohistidine phosphatase SixA
MTAMAALLFISVFAGCSPTRASRSSAPESEPLVVFLVRHAEKTDVASDPGLSAAGIERAAALARVLRSAEIQHVHSSDFTRTRHTARPIAAEYGVEVELYDPRDLPSLVERLRRTGGRHLVVGHSNTTPQMVELLGGTPGPAINEEGEYDRLYIVTIGSDKAVNSVMMRYGAGEKGDDSG